MISHQLSKQGGTTLIEVLVAMVILAIGLMGLVGLQARLQVLQMESYQRSQALLLLHDIAARITSNRYAAPDYALAATVVAPVGADMDCPTSTATRVDSDIHDWCLALQGAGETLDGGGKVGTMVGGRGCIENLGGGGDEFLITVAWQGLAPVSAPPAEVACGATAYDGGPDSACQAETCRRVVTTLVRLADLD